MNDICIPIPRFKENEIAEVVVTVNGEKRHFNFRVESFPWTSESDKTNQSENTIRRIEELRHNIETYDKEWELIQIYTPTDNANYIQVLFRQKWNRY
ncbi:MAG: hypothetical protein K9J12_14340 [Melioribacteraceae bacterium]|nr:hypothetical protein [Melioribacteraceae bacterium]MCF8263713.1 hypothetical protein [Melioribacteraceae bacterium]MCF8414097.1 hypothetical protein [Melioribacteraceae bacterium]MCF8432050.1 hypothetical protein [Melioribacteraceae bacterium]